MQAHMDLLVLRVQHLRPAHRDCPARPVLLVLLAPLAKMVRMERKERQVKKDHREMQA